MQISEPNECNPSNRKGHTFGTNNNKNVCDVISYKTTYFTFMKYLIYGALFRQAKTFICMKYKTGVINDSLGQTHSLAGSQHCFLLFCFSRFEKWGRTYGWTYGQYVRKQWSLPAVTLGWPSGSIKRESLTIWTVTWAPKIFIRR